MYISFASVGCDLLPKVGNYRAQLLCFPYILFRSSSQGQTAVINLYLQTIEISIGTQHT